MTCNSTLCEVLALVELLFLKSSRSSIKKPGFIHTLPLICCTWWPWSICIWTFSGFLKHASKMSIKKKWVDSYTTVRYGNTWPGSMLKLGGRMKFLKEPGSRWYWNVSFHFSCFGGWRGTCFCLTTLIFLISNIL